MKRSSPYYYVLSYFDPTLFLKRDAVLQVALRIFKLHDSSSIFYIFKSTLTQKEANVQLFTRRI